MVRIGLLINPDNPFVAFQTRETVAAAQELKIQNISAEASSPDQIEGAFKNFQRQNVQICIVPLDQMFLQERTRILALAAAARLPTIAAWPDDAVDGYLMSYGVSLRESYRQVAGYVARILEGTKASNLPVDFPAKVDLVVNLRMAKILDITVPPNLLIQATAVIE
jgi:putative ABC transport system substrate-binding protein